MDKIELKVLSNLYSDPDENGDMKLIKKNIVKRITIHDKNTIVYHEESIGKKGTVLKNECFIKVDGEVFKVKHSYDYISGVINKGSNSIGFKK